MENRLTKILHTTRSNRKDVETMWEMVEAVEHECPEYITKYMEFDEFHDLFNTFLDSDGNVSEASIMLMRKHESLDDTIYEVIDIITLSAPSLWNINNFGFDKTVYDPTKKNEI